MVLEIPVHIIGSADSEFMGRQKTATVEVCAGKGGGWSLHSGQEAGRDVRSEKKEGN